MDNDCDGPDTSSIKPISSLRSKFENAAKEHNADTSAGTAAARSAFLTASGSTPLKARAASPGGEKDVAGPGVSNFRGVVQPMLAPTPRKGRPEHVSPRPSSMISTQPAIPASPTRPSPPTLKVNSPRSPGKSFSVDLRPSAGNTPLAPLTPNRTGEMTPTKSHSRSISRATTPAIEARMNALFQAADTKAQEGEATEAPPIPLQSKPQVESRPAAAKPAPPAINRAAKPDVPAKPSALAKKPSALAAPEARAELTDQSASPFGTPPSSGGSSPRPRRDSAARGPHPNKNESHSAVNRVRADPNASWVQRVRSDSDDSIRDRARAESDASFIEPSSLPDNWYPQPSHHSAAFANDPNHPGIAKAPSMPARYRASQDRDVKQSNDSAAGSRRLPLRPELQIRSGCVSPPKPRSGRTSPLKAQMLPPRRSVDALRRTVAKPDAEAAPRIPAVKLITKSAITQGFTNAAASPSTLTPTSGPPPVPAARRSVDRRREPPPPPPITTNGQSHDDREEAIPPLSNESGVPLSEYPDATRANRRPPKFKQRPWQIPTDYDTRLFAVCGEVVCTTGYITKCWNIRTGEQLLQMEHRENTKITSVVFKPSPDIEAEGLRIWLGTNSGDIHEVDIPSHSIVKSKIGAHSRREVIRMFRYASELWTLDDGGELFVWKPDHKGMPSLDSQHNNWRVPKGHTFSLQTGKLVWIAYGKDIRVFAPSAQSDTGFQLTKAPLSQPGTGEVTCGATLNHKNDIIYFGHSDGKVSIYSRRDFSCQGVVNVSVYRIACMAGVGEYLWAGYSTGMAYVYDTSTTPWTVRKDWKAHEKQLCSIVADPSAMWKMGRLNVITLGLDNLLRIWDGMLQEDWIETRMHARDADFCSFRELTATVLTWNAGACKPSHTQHSKEDASFFKDYLRYYRDPPDIFIFGFQELVDLEDKKVTAKSFFKSKKKDPADQEHMSHQYRAWRDYLGKCIDDYMPTNTTYTLLHTASMVGLFTCVFVRSAERPRIRYVHTSEVKRGMGGIHGNKGAIILRMVLDDSSICLINCHLAAGQTQTMHRNNDIAEILEANALPAYPLSESEAAEHSDVFASGGDGSMIMDHEICILNGDLNYRIDTMGRDSVVKHVQQGNLSRLLERDQLLLSRRKNPGFRLRAFHENPISFAPTYKYNVHTDDYDTSEKRRSPAWCDRILYRGLGRVKMDEYRRWDQIRISDHRPVSGRLKLRVKTVHPDQRATVWNQCGKEFEIVRDRIARAAQLEYLTNVLGLTQKDAVAALQGSR